MHILCGGELPHIFTNKKNKKQQKQNNNKNNKKTPPKTQTKPTYNNLQTKWLTAKCPKAVLINCCKNSQSIGLA